MKIILIVAIVINVDLKDLVVIMIGIIVTVIIIIVKIFAIEDVVADFFLTFVIALDFNLL